MSSSDFVHIANRIEAGKADRLFRAAVVAFCALTRPTRRDAIQLEDLVLPLFDAASTSSRRFVAACLAQMPEAPAALVRRLAEEPVEISAPLIIRSPKLTDIDLLALIGRRGLPHAKAIGRRPHLNPTIANLVRMLEKNAPLASQPGDTAMPRPAPVPETRETLSASPADSESHVTPAEAVRNRLREMMRSPTTAPAIPARLPLDHVPRGAIFAKLRATALTGNTAYFQTALADALGIEFGIAKAMTLSDSYRELVFALKALDLDAEEAFILVAATFPTHVAHPAGIRHFVERYELCHPDVAGERLRGWKADSLAASFHDAGSSGAPRGSNTNDRTPTAAALKAS